jgi:hypothetical protein
MMPRHERSLPINNATLKTLMQELGDECSRVLGLMHQLQMSNLQDDQKADILLHSRSRLGQFPEGVINRIL